MSWRIGMVGAALLLGACGGGEPELISTSPSPTTTIAAVGETAAELVPATPLTPQARLLGLVDARSEQWSHRAAIRLDGFGDVAAEAHWDGGRGIVDQNDDVSKVRFWISDGPSIVAVDNGQAYRYPEPTADLSNDTADPLVFIRALADLPLAELSSEGGRARIEARCEDRTGVPETFLLFTACGPDAETTITIDFDELTTNGSWTAVGSMEVWPGQWSAFTAEGTFGPLDPDVDLAPPADVDEQLWNCVSDALGVSASDPAAIGSALDPMTTEENFVLFDGCGSEIWPPGVDLRQ